MESLEEIELRLVNKDPEQRIDALLDAWEYNTAGIELVVRALEDKVRKVRQSALLLLSESETKIAKQALWNYLPFSQMQCLHTIIEFKFNSFDTKYYPDYFAIADYNNSLVCYSDVEYKRSGIAIYDLETGKAKTNHYLSMAHEFGLGKDGKVFVTSYQDFLQAYNLETLEGIYKFSDKQMNGSSPRKGEFTVCKKNFPLVAVCQAYSHGHRNNRNIIGFGEFEIWNYDTYDCLLHYEFEDLLLFTSNRLSNIRTKSLEVFISPLIFTPSGDFLIVRYMDRQKCCLVQIWNTDKLELVQTLENLPRLTITSVGVRPNKTIIACGIREEKVCAWELQSDEIIYTVSEVSPCILSTDGRVLIYATVKHEIVIIDLVADRELVTLQGHKTAIAYLALSEDRQFLASYSIDRQIKIWAIPDYS